MTDSDLFDSVVGQLVATAKGHHAATGGTNPQWARWYSEHLVSGLNETLGSDIDVDELEAWLIDADVRYRSEEQTSSWPKAYAGWLMADFT